MWSVVLIDSCVMMDAVMPLRENYDRARTLFGMLASKRIQCLIPSHAYFEYVVTQIVHYKREPEKLQAPYPDFPYSNLKLEFVPLTNDYVLSLIEELKSSPFPDLKSQDMIFFCIARNRGATLLTGDRKLRNTCRKAGISAFEIEEAIQSLRQTN